MVYLRRTRFIIDSSFPLALRGIIRPLERFLEQFRNGFKSIRLLTFHEVCSYGSSTIPEQLYPGSFISRCTGLQDLILDFRLCHLLRFSDDDDESPEKSGKENPAAELLSTAGIEDRWGLRGLYRMEKLKFVQFRCLVEHGQLARYRLEKISFLDLPKERRIHVHREAIKLPNKRTRRYDVPIRNLPPTAPALRDISGFILSCRQVYKEVEHEVVRAVYAYLYHALQAGWLRITKSRPLGLPWPDSFSETVHIVFTIEIPAETY